MGFFVDGKGVRAIMGFMVDDDQQEVRDVSEYEQSRREKVGKLRELGVEPYGYRFEGAESLAVVVGRYDAENEEQVVRGAGRLVLYRDIGKLIFATTLFDRSRFTTENVTVFLSVLVVAEHKRLDTFGCLDKVALLIEHSTFSAPPCSRKSLNR